MSGPDLDRAVYVISVAAELAGLHAQTLRIYERKGLLEPSRTPGGSRRYSERDIQRLSRISELTDEGLNLAGVRRVLELEEEVLRLRTELSQLTEAARRQVADAERRQRRDLVPLRQDVILWSDRHPRRPT
ncbi:MAG: MerR family transcriptional regulator [Actinomycetota bacterium]